MSTWGWPGWWMRRCCWWGISTGAACSHSSTVRWLCWRRMSAPGSKASWSTSSGGTGRSWSRDWPSWKSCAACRWRGCCPISTWTSTMRTAFLAASAGIRRQSWWTSPSFACPGSPISRTWDLLSATKMCRCGMWPPYGSWARRTASFCREPRVPLETFCGCGRAAWRLR